MIQIGSTIVSLDIIEKKFVCNLARCKGMCCVYGESGAPLEDREITILKKIYPKIKPYMTLEIHIKYTKNKFVILRRTTVFEILKRNSNPHTLEMENMLAELPALVRNLTKPH